MRPFSSYHLLVLALASLVPTHQAQFQEPLPKIDLDKKSYIIDLTVRNGDESSSYEIVEMHSAWQERSKIHFETYGQAKRQNPKDANVNTFYADPMVVLKINPRDPPSCLEVSHDYVDKMFNQNILVGFKSSYLIGAARLLSFVDQNREKFSMVKPTGDKSERASGCEKMFGAMLNTRAGEEFKLTLCYHEETGKNLANGIPRAIIIVTKSGSTIYQFTRYQPLKEGTIQTSASSINSFDQNSLSKPGEIALDMFALNPNYGCSHALDEGDHLMKLVSPDSYRFSFAARSQAPKADEFTDMTVAYESTLATLRVDQVQTNRAVTRLIDFWSSVQYHIVRKLSKMDNQVLDRVLKPDEDYSCVVSKAQDDYVYHETNKNQFTLGQTLLGTDKLVYLGVARVRGIETRVYESHDCNLPVWLQGPAFYETKDVKTGDTMRALRDEVKLMKEQGHSRTNVFYFAKGSSDENKIWEAKLLLVEVFIQNDRINQMFKLSYPIYDFSWDLPSSSPAGGRYEDSFSLQDDCVAVGDRAEYATIDLLLETSVDYTTQAWLQDRVKRNLALLRLAQSTLSIHPIAMIYDIESRLTIGAETDVPGSHWQNRLASLAVSMRTAQRRRTPVRLVYMGQEKFNLQYMDVIEVANFQTCYMLAAHLKVDTIFGYRVYTYECFLIKPQIVSRYGGDLKRLMEDARSSIKSAVEIYQVLHEDIPYLEYSRLGNFEDVLKRRADAHLINPSKSSSSLKVDFKSYGVNRLNEKLTYDLDQLHLNGTNKFRGFGLVASDGQNKLVEIRQTDDHQTQTHFGKEMSFENCQTACLGDFECRSFSVCIERGEMRCVLSKVSFATPSIAIQLMLLMEKKAKLGEKFSVNVDLNEQNYSNTNSKEDSPMETIQLMSHRGCELHNKQYLDVFQFQGRKPIKFMKGVMPVASLDQCAELCFRSTLESFSAQLDKLANLKARPSRKSLLGEGSCHEFQYIGRESVDQFDAGQRKKFLEQLVDSDQSKAPVNGYCTWNGQSGYINRQEGQIEFHYHHYKLNFLTLYTKHAGVSMVESPITLQERLSLDKLRNEEIAPFIKPNENYGRLFISNPEYGDHRGECAEQCVMHFSITAYPACRSFDVFEVIDQNNSLKLICAYNSISLESALAAKREDLIRIGADKQVRVNFTHSERVRVWHYEPRHGLVAQYLDQTYKIQLAQDIRAAEAKRGLIHMGTFGLFCCLVVVLSLGITAGLTLGSRYFAGSQPVYNDTSELIEDRMAPPRSTKLEFNNLVTIHEANGELDLSGH